MGFISDLIDWLFHRWPVPTPPVPPTPSPTPNISSGAVITEINRIRLQRGLGLLWEDSLISKVSQQWASAMAANEALDHGNFFERIASVYPDKPAGEDIAAGQTSAVQVVGDWMDDPPHRETLLGNYNHIGIGVARSPRGTLYWVVDLVLV